MRQLVIVSDITLPSFFFFFLFGEDFCLVVFRPRVLSLPEGRGGAKKTRDSARKLKVGG